MNNNDQTSIIEEEKIRAPHHSMALPLIAVGICAIVAVLLCVLLYFSLKNNMEKPRDDGFVYMTSADAPWFALEGQNLKFSGETVPADVVIPDFFDGTEITSFAGGSCEGAVTVTGGAKLTEIKNGAFQGCTTVQKVTFPKVTDIGQNSFKGCDSLTHVYADSVRVVYSSAFEGCTSLEFFSSNSISNVGDSAFLGCTSLKEINLTSALRLGEKCFENSGLSYASIGVTEIYPYAFKDCKALYSVTLGKGAKAGAGVFSGCSALKKADLPENLTSLPDEFFAGCTSLSEVHFDRVVSIGKGTFKGCTAIKELTVPAGVQSVGDGAFENCTGIENVNIEANLKYIQEGSFKGCTSITKVRLPQTCVAISDSAFEGCTALSSVTVPKSVQLIGSSAFRGCSKLGSVTLTLGLQSMGDGAFADCTALKRITLPSGLISLGEEVFAGCTALEKLDLPATITSLGDGLVKNCTSLKSFGLFADCTVSATMFLGCESMEKVTVSGNNSSYVSRDGVLYSADSSTLVYCPQALASCSIYSETATVAPYAFSGSAINTIDLSNIEIISMNAFEGCQNLENVTFGKGVYISYGAFINCPSLEKVTLPEGAQVDDGAFDEKTSM